MEQGKIYAMKVESRGHGLGLPHLFVVGPMMLEIVKMSEAPPVAKEMVDKFGEMRLEDRQEVVRFSRVAKVYQKDQKKLVLSFAPTQIGMSFRAILIPFLSKLEHWDARMGRPPMGFMYRELGELREGFLEDWCWS